MKLQQMSLIVSLQVKLATIRNLTVTPLNGAWQGLSNTRYEVADFYSKLMRTYDLEDIVT